MQEPYRVVDVEEAIDPKGADDQESRGTRKKFWYRDRESESTRLFKYPRENTGEHWAEKIAAEVAGLLGIPCSRVDLAVYNRTRGTVSDSFVDEGWELVHGNQALTGTMFRYDPQLRFGQSDHRLENIYLAIERTFIGDDAVEKTKRQFAEYVVLDAVIGNTDRHHENWGILRTWTDEGLIGCLAPSFDHASSLGRELSDEKRNQRLTENSIGHYAHRGRGGIYWSNSEKRAPSPLELVRLAARGEPDIFRPAISRLEKLNDDSLRELVNRVPDGWMTPIAREFAVALMRYNIHTMRRLIQ